MELGIFTSMFKKYSIMDTAAKVAEKGFSSVQLSLAFDNQVLSAEELTPEKCKEIKDGFDAHNIDIVAIGGYKNLVNPDGNQRQQGISDLKKLISACPHLNCSFVVTESGSANPDHGWTDHPDNYLEKTWDLLMDTLKGLCQHARSHGVTLLIEPHFAHVTKDPGTLRRLLDGVGERNLKIVSDPANFITPVNISRIDQVLEDFFVTLGKDIGLVHGKDVLVKNGKSVFVGAGSGALNYSLYVQLLNQHGYKGPLVLEYIGESGIDAAKAYVLKHIR